ncbi:hypothetical protein SKAU_G00371230 [Synaphobranchus kaupii]|uniref:Uncharacterized protein n=1 Tax=Synaphobranchus kaupii TaxID=118154 RepID=A0A9Q1EG32_SYNKA|nr:hypothetical protein SKAU_G00371230 [Synaphobranchus kaupii]
MRQSDTRPTEKTHRQVSKPLMERRRRARINGCLGELRTLLLQSHIAQSCRRSKLEKADILELTVRHLKALTQSNGLGSFADVAMSRFYAGYSDCAREVSRFLNTSDGINHTVRGSLLRRLSDRATALTSGGALPNHRPESPVHRLTFERFPTVSSGGSSVIESHLLKSLQSVVGGQPVTLPVANSAFSFLLQPRQESLDPGVSTQLVRVNTVLDSKVHTATSCTSETVWRPW